jgi:hypothetical protein
MLFAGHRLLCGTKNCIHNRMRALRTRDECISCVQLTRPVDKQLLMCHVQYFATGCTTSGVLGMDMGTAARSLAGYCERTVRICEHVYQGSVKGRARGTTKPPTTVTHTFHRQTKALAFRQRSVQSWLSSKNRLIFNLRSHSA